MRQRVHTSVQISFQSKEKFDWLTAAVIESKIIAQLLRKWMSIVNIDQNLIKGTDFDYDIISNCVFRIPARIYLKWTGSSMRESCIMALKKQKHFNRIYAEL